MYAYIGGSEMEAERTMRLQVRLTPGEYEALCAWAAQADTTISALVRRHLLGTRASGKRARWKDHSTQELEANMRLLEAHLAEAYAEYNKARKGADRRLRQRLLEDLNRTDMELGDLQTELEARHAAAESGRDDEG